MLLLGQYAHHCVEMSMGAPLSSHIFKYFYQNEKALLVVRCALPETPRVSDTTALTQPLTEMRHEDYDMRAEVNSALVIFNKRFSGQGLRVTKNIRDSDENMTLTPLHTHKKAPIRCKQRTGLFNERVF